MNVKAEISALKKQVRLLQVQHAAPNVGCLTTKEAAEWLGYSTTTVREYVQNGMLVRRFPNSKKQFHPDDVELFMRGRKPYKGGKK